MKLIMANKFKARKEKDIFGREYYEIEKINESVGTGDDGKFILFPLFSMLVFYQFISYVLLVVLKGETNEMEITQINKSSGTFSIVGTLFHLVGGFIFCVVFNQFFILFGTTLLFTIICGLVLWILKK
jgi:hypothetical protein